MSKSTYGLGKFSGKLGGLVFAVRNGVQIQREYNAHPNNPKTNDQRVQRAKGVLAGKLSHIIPADIIAGMNGSGKAGRRAEFQSVLLKAIESQISITTGTAKATLMPEKLVLSQGLEVNAVSVLDGGTSYGDGVIHVTWGLGTWTGQARFVALLSYWNGSEYEWHLETKVLNVADRQWPISVPLSWTTSGNYGDAFIYAIPIVIDEETLRLNGTPLTPGDDNTTLQFVASLVATESSAISYAASEFVGKVQLSF